MGECYYLGRGIKKILIKRFSIIKTAEQGHVVAQCYLGQAFSDGEGVRKNYKKAVQWYLLAASAGDDNAQVSMGFHYFYGLGVPKNVNEAIL